MVLRPDEPALNYHERAQATTAGMVRETQPVTLLKIYRLLWVALALLVALVFPSLKNAMAIVAVAMEASFLLLGWETGRAGRS